MWMPRRNGKTSIVPKRRVAKSKSCRGCGKSVKRTAGGLGYCKSCIRVASQQSYKEYVNGNS